MTGRHVLLVTSFGYGIEVTNSASGWSQQRSTVSTNGGFLLLRSVIQLTSLPSGGCGRERNPLPGEVIATFTVFSIIRRPRRQPVWHRRTSNRIALSPFSTSYPAPWSAATEPVTPAIILMGATATALVPAGCHHRRRCSIIVTNHIPASASIFIFTMPIPVPVLCFNYRNSMPTGTQSVLHHQRNRIASPAHGNAGQQHFPRSRLE